MTGRPRQPKVGTPTLTVRSVPMDTLLTDPANARLHNTRNLDAIRASLRRFSQQKPLVVDEHNVIVAGNGTYEAAQLEGWEHIDVVVFPGTAAEARAYAIADNRTAELAHWDGEVLLQTLTAMDNELLLAAGYDGDDLADFQERFGPAAGLDDLAGRHGSPTDDALWPTLRIQAPQELLDRYSVLVDSTGADNHLAFQQIIEWAERGSKMRKPKAST